MVTNEGRLSNWNWKESYQKYLNVCFDIVMLIIILI